MGKLARGSNSVISLCVSLNNRGKGANLCVKMCFPKSRKGKQTASQKFRVCK